MMGKTFFINPFSHWFIHSLVHSTNDICAKYYGVMGTSTSEPKVCEVDEHCDTSSMIVIELMADGC